VLLTLNLGVVVVVLVPEPLLPRVLVALTAALALGGSVVDGVGLPLAAAVAVALTDARGDAMADAVAEAVASDARLRPSSTGSPSTNVPLRPAGCQPACWARASHSAWPVAASAASTVRCTLLTMRMLGTTPVTLAYSAHASGGVAGA
jgi:hypothetical protein